MKQVNIILFDKMTTLDALGPAEVFSRLENHYQIHYFSLNGGVVTSSTGNQLLTRPLSTIEHNDILLIPGGLGTRELVNDDIFIREIKQVAMKSEYVLSVCTGSALLAKTGLLNGKRATSNKVSWNWVINQSEEVQWIKSARWVVDEKYYTSSGITAGIDMALGFISDRMGIKTANEISHSLEYIWNRDKTCDPFSH